MGTTVIPVTVASPRIHLERVSRLEIVLLVPTAKLVRMVLPLARRATVAAAAHLDTAAITAKLLTIVLLVPTAKLVRMVQPLARRATVAAAATLDTAAITAKLLSLCARATVAWLLPEPPVPLTERSASHAIVASRQKEIRVQKRSAPLENTWCPMNVWHAAPAKQMMRVTELEVTARTVIPSCVTRTKW
jgi:hypothetical protein